MKPFPVVAAHQLAARPEAERWLIEQVWMDQSVGIVGGEPKLGKSLAALSMAVSLASGEPYLGRFRVAQTGRTLLFAAEDAHHIVRARLEALCLGLDLALADLDIQVITASRLRIDSPDHQKSLADTLSAVRPKLLILDPFVRLHTRDENQCAEVAPLLGFLRDLQRTFEVAVAVVHHTRKGAGRTRGGQALRGSSEFHAWVDDAQYLRHSGDRVLLSIEHRAAPCIDKLEIKLRASGAALSLEVVDDQPPPNEDLAAPGAADRILEALASTNHPLTIKALRQKCSMRHERFLRALGALVRDGRVVKTNGTYHSAA